MSVENYHKSKKKKKRSEKDIAPKHSTKFSYSV